MKKIILVICSIICFSPLFSQTDSSSVNRKDALNIFLDCMFCDQSHIRREIPFVNYVRDRLEAQLHVMVTMQMTGAGGVEYTFHFLGQQEFDNVNDTLVFVSSSDDTGENIREGQVRTLKAGLIQYVAKTPLIENINISYTEKIEEEVKDDPWNSWVFRARINGSADGQKTYKSWRLSGSVRASRVTPEWKIEMDAYYSRYENSYEIGDEIIVNSQHNESFDALIVKSLTNHWSAGGGFDMYSSYYSNYDLRASLSPGIEYNIFPYSESTRKQLRILYRAGIEFNNYIDTTIYNKIEELLYLQRLSLNFQVTQKWGSVYSSLGWKNYFHDWRINNLNFFTSFNIRITKGLRLNIGGSAGLIHDQINLRKGVASDEEILLRRRQLETSFRYSIHFGISYTFGSIYNNVVNPRFGGSGGMYIIY